MSRRCEVLGSDGHWRESAHALLQIGDVFQLFETDGRAVVDDAGFRRWRALAPASATASGAVEIDAEPVPETEVERTVREGRVWWPESRSRLPGRLRG